MFLQKTAFFLAKATDVVSASGENSKLSFFAATAWSFSPGSACCNYSYSAMQERMWLNVYLYINTKIIHTPSPVFLELMIRIDLQSKSATRKNSQRFQGLMYSVYCSSFLVKLILKKYFSVAIVGNEGSLESNIYSTILSTKNWYEYGIRLVGKKDFLFWLLKRKYGCDRAFRAW